MQGMKQQFSILTSVTMAMILTACSYSDISLEEHADSNATATERIPITLNAPSVRTETTVTDTRAADNSVPEYDFSVWCLPTGLLGSDTDTDIDMTTATIPMANVYATLDKNTNTLKWNGGETYYYPEYNANGENYRYALFTLYPAAEPGQYTKTTGDVTVALNVDGNTNYLWSRTTTPADDYAYAYSEAYWQRNHKGAAPQLQTLQHITAAVTVNVTVPEGCTISSISLNDMPSTATFSMMKGKVLSVGTETKDYTANNVAGYTFYVMPQQSNPLKLKIEYTKDGEATAPTYTTNAILLEAGKEYTITINIDE